MDKFCKQCGNLIVSKHARIFCCQSCSAKYNNKGVRRHGKPRGNCLNCNELMTRTQKKFCNTKCQSEFYYKKRFSEFGISAFSIVVIKKHILFERGHKCEQCNLKEWLDKPITLEIHHVDGNYKNNELDNLKLLCPNCHSMTDTYKNKNKGNGRSYRNATLAQQ